MIGVLLVAGACALASDPSAPSRGAATAEVTDGPNVVVIVVDDLGWTDPQFMGHAWHRTPGMNRLAREGVVFHHGYAAAANCAPSRAAMMTGLYAPRTGVYTVGSPERGKSANRRLVPVPNERTLAPSFVTFAEVLAAAGWRTAHVGKWHLGKGDAGPLGQGFDVNVGGNVSGHPRSYLSPYRNADLPDGPDGEYLTDRLVDEAVAWVDVDDDRPFLLHLAFYSVHTPIQPDPRVLAKVAVRPEMADRETFEIRYTAMVESCDRAIERLLDHLDARGLTEDTLVVFVSDNGGYGGVTTMAPLAGVKGMYREGGIRVPFVVRWPGRVAPRQSDVPVHGVDLFPTLLAAAGVAPPADLDLDGVDLWPLITTDEPLPERALFWHFPAYLEANANVRTRLGTDTPWRTTPVSVIRRGDFKLLEWFETGMVDLHDVVRDVGERVPATDLLRDRTEALRAELSAWRDAVDAPVPTELNAEYVEP